MKKNKYFRKVLDLELSYVFEGSIRTGSQYTNMGLLRHGFNVVGEGSHGIRNNASKVTKNYLYIIDIITLFQLPDLTSPSLCAYPAVMLTREQMQNALIERLFWHTAERNEAKVADHLFYRKEMDTVYTLDEATLFDFFFHYLREDVCSHFFIPSRKYSQVFSDLC